MNEPLRVLIVEDSEDDTLLVIKELRRGGFEPDWERIETVESLQTMLTDRVWDVIISDYRLPRFDAPTALAILQRSQLDLPFIVVAGSIGELLAVEMMKAGAHDYLMKDKLTRLPEAVRRELREAKIRAERKVAQQQLEQLNQELETKVAERTATLQERESQLQLANEELLRASRLKDEFLATMSHELRTPLNAILGMTEGLQEGIFGLLNDGQNHALQTIERSGSHLLSLINDILDVAKIEAGQMELDLVSTSIGSLCQSSLEFIQTAALKKLIQLEMRLDFNLPDVLVDQRRIRQVLINLLNNAVKFTPPGGRICLEVSRTKNADSPEPTISMPQDWVRIAVSDTGIGIASKDLDKLFQSFVQIDSQLNRNYGGTGLGLVLVKRIVELHGGQVGVTSEVGVGSCFTIDLPDREAAPPPSAVYLPPIPIEQIHSQPAPQSAMPTLLLVEDNEANISTMSSYLIAKGYHLLVARTGEFAVELAKSTKPDMILMDIQMPGMNGLEAIAQIRLDPDLVQVPIVALTALVMPEDRDRCLAAGANEYLTKPIKLKQLVTIIQQLLV